MLDAQKRRNLAALAKQKKPILAPSVKDKKMKVVAEVAPSEDEDTCSGLVFKRKLKVDGAISAPSDSDGRAPSYGNSPSSASSPHDIAVQEGRGESASKGDQWDSSSDPTSFLQKMLFSTKVKGRLESLEEDLLMEHMSRQLGEALVANCLLLSKMRKAKEMANKEVLQTVELKRQVTGLTLEVEELRRTSQETKVLLFGKSQEALRLYVKNNDLYIKVEKLKGELVSRDEEVARQKEEIAQKNELLQKTNDELMSDVADSYVVGFEDDLAQVTCVHPEVDLSESRLGKAVIDGQLVDVE